MIASPLLSQLEQAKNGLEDAQIALCGAVTAHAEAKRTLELAEAARTLAGIDGKNEKERAAKLRLELTTEYEALHEAEDNLAEARCALEGARLEFGLDEGQDVVVVVVQVKRAPFKTPFIRLGQHLLEPGYRKGLGFVGAGAPYVDVPGLEVLNLLLGAGHFAYAPGEAVPFGPVLVGDVAAFIEVVAVVHGASLVDTFPHLQKVCFSRVRRRF